jgi:type II secretory ATPase GspE/PulE/Tfp pilus assembly ATPase PilB-like protein
VIVSTMPGFFGESVVLRIVDAARGASWTWELLEFDAVERMQALLGRPEGLILFTGPPGSGKTAALFGALHALDAEALNIVAVTSEQPGEGEGINLSAAGLPMAEAIQALAERDADVIAVDEAQERAEIEAALGAALAGHRVLVAFPASDIAGAIERLIGLGVSPRQLSAALTGIVGSRLARRICPGCREVDQPREESLRALAITPEQAAAAVFARGKGCDDCRGSGCRGWAGLYQVLTIDATVASLIAAGADRLREHLSASGLPSLQELAVEKTLAGVIAVDEALRFIEE